MKRIQLYKDGREILGSDGIMFMDGRYGSERITAEVKKHVDTYRKNFPHLVADEYGIYAGGFLSEIVKRVKL